MLQNVSWFVGICIVIKCQQKLASQTESERIKKRKKKKKKKEKEKQRKSACVHLYFSLQFLLFHDIHNMLCFYSDWLRWVKSTFQSLFLKKSNFHFESFRSSLVIITNLSIVLFVCCCFLFNPENCDLFLESFFSWHVNGINTGISFNVWKTKRQVVGRMINNLSLLRVEQ